MDLKKSKTRNKVDFSTFYHTSKQIIRTRIFFFINLLIVFNLIFFSICFADTVHLKRSRKSIFLNVDKVTDEYIVATIKKSQVDNISIKPDRNKTFPDIIYFTIDPYKTIRCKIIDMADKFYTIKLPMQDIESLEISKKNSSSNYGTTYSDDKEIRKRPLLEDGSQKDDLLGLELVEEMEFDTVEQNSKMANPDQLIREPFPDFDNRTENSDDTVTNDSFDTIDPARLKEEIKKELMEAMNKQKEDEEEKFLFENTGKVSGKIFRNGKPYPGCKVQIVALAKERILFAKVVKRGNNYETVTDENGMYYFKNVPPGGYKLFWKPDYSTSWIRRFDMKPDIMVIPGKTTFHKTLEINKRVMN